MKKNILVVLWRLGQRRRLRPGHGPGQMMTGLKHSRGLVGEIVLFSNMSPVPGTTTDAQ